MLRTGSRGGPISLALLACRWVAAAGLALGVAALSKYPFDDAFIHFRIASNLAFEGQPYFNLGERVAGDSSPLWMASLAALFALAGRADPRLVVAFASLLVVALQLCAERLLERAAGRRRLGTVLGAPLLVAALVLPSAGCLMEPALGLLLATLGALALARGAALPAGVAFALAATARPELSLLAGFALVATRAPDRLRFLGGLLPPLLAVAALLLAAFGTVVPHTLLAKSVVYVLDLRRFLRQVPGFGLPVLPLVAGWLAAATTIAVWSWRSASRAASERANLARAVAILAAFSPVLFLAYTARRVMLFAWYWPTLVFPAALAAAAVLLQPREGAEGGGEVAGRGQWLRASRNAAWVAALAVLACAIPHAATAALSLRAALRDRPLESATLAGNYRTYAYLRMGDALERACPGHVLMTSEIGALGWTYRGKILDGVGLVSPEVLPYHPLAIGTQRPSGTVGAIPARAVRDLQPDLVVGMEIFLGEFLAERRRDGAAGPYRLALREGVLGASTPGRELWASRYVQAFARSGACGGTLPAIAE